jgi:adenosyl cobinamide kinase/adenosyl cobinamide phosphate guanylyltransferase
MARRLRQLEALRPSSWDAVTVTRDLAAALDGAAGRFEQILVDSMSQWLAGLLVGDADETSAEIIEAEVKKQVDEVLSIIERRPGLRLVFVSAEAGAAPTPQRPIERLYRRMVGEVNQRLARAARAVVAVHAGIPLLLK